MTGCLDREGVCLGVGCSDGVLEIVKGVCLGEGCSDGVLEIGRGVSG